jgi:hypothetical protein
MPNIEAPDEAALAVTFQAPRAEAAVLENLWAREGFHFSWKSGYIQCYLAKNHQMRLNSYQPSQQDTTIFAALRRSIKGQPETCRNPEESLRL